ncbi:hypothetical protein HanRHA438_Chr12g0563471 [Helianthus annuus]|uniref:RPN1 N-terminal domain-containing protein n=1 Tax=Helianthus annuus TaxID=4232 RepID=A0A251T3G2_HELAN|nr:hypothetical protein HanXRQr2_Chr12g0552111 [Helianthus annuus]KAJ0506094.1 hypothetical protein HanHA89_Chr12g0478031 [Helianthus annuus]KAJ0675765.1 hypothetical protein HanLR1_Chr12g0454931 [Helianthus annuus]KAJ0867463.1 hypothetical protein HanRHA438_Chr12g0563471 [Helianthus annuus]
MRNMYYGTLKSYGTLKFLRPHYGTLKSYYETMPDSDLKKLLADVLLVLALTMSAEGDRKPLPIDIRLLGALAEKM